MPKAELKTTKTEASVDDFINAVAEEGQQADAHAIVKLMQAATKAPPKMWVPPLLVSGRKRSSIPAVGNLIG